MSPTFPEFKPIELSDRPGITGFLDRYRPRTSELTFTNLFIWRRYFQWEWSILDGRLIVIAAAATGGGFALPPIGDAPRVDVTRSLLDYLGGNRGMETPGIQRADRRLADELGQRGRFHR